MIVTVLWEDQLGSEARGFGPHELLVTCLTEELGMDRESLRRCIFSVPKKGVGNIRTELRKNIRRLTRSGPVVAVVDRDNVIDL